MTAVVAIGAALIGASAGVGFRAIWEDRSALVGAVRAVSSELRANAIAMGRSDPFAPTLGETLGDLSYRANQLILARKLKHDLWLKLDQAYATLTPRLREGVVTGGYRTIFSGLSHRMNLLADALETYDRPWHKRLGRPSAKDIRQ